MKSILATLDLEQALQAFCDSVTPALAVGDVHEWDGCKLWQREAEIVQAALVLAGQCVALLL